MGVQRIGYIDALRGFSMILVIYYHVIDHCFLLKYIGFNSVFLLFLMPLFFFISGFVFYKTDRHWNFHTLKDFISKKFIFQIIPTAIFLCVFLYLNHAIEWSSFGTFKSGYWFTLILFEYFLFYCIFAFILQGVMHVIWGEIILLVFALFISLLGFYYIDYYPYIGWFKPVGELIDALNWRYFLFFCVGALIRKYFTRFQTVIDNQYLMALILCVFGFLSNVAINNKLAETNFVYFFFCGLLGIIIVFSFFRKYSSCSAKENKLGCCLQYVGRRTLDIYLLHFFFLPTNLNHIGLYLAQYSNSVIDFFLTLVLSILVLCIVLVVSNIIRLSPFLAHYLFGVKREG